MTNFINAIVLVACIWFQPGPHYGDQPYNIYHDRQAVYCTYEGEGYLGCYDQPGRPYFVNLDDAEDPSGEGYKAWPVAFDERTETVRWIVGDLSYSTVHPGQAVELWVVDLSN